jgi:hypothetical protein
MEVEMTRSQKFTLKIALTYAGLFLAALIVSMAAVTFALAKTADERLAETFDAIGEALQEAQGAIAPEPNVFPKCAATSDYASFLERQFKETLSENMGRIDAQHVMQIYVSAEGTWTALITDTNGRSCIGPSGDAWMGELPEAPAPSDAPQFQILPQGGRGA